MANRIITRSLFYSVAVLLGISRATFGLGDDGDRPPPLTFDRHVDYVAWYTRHVSDRKTDNAFAEYTKLCPNGDPAAALGELDESLSKNLKIAGSRVWDREEFPDVFKYLDAHSAEIAALQRAARHKHFWQPLTTDELALWQVPTEYATNCRTIARALTAQSTLMRDNQSTHLLATWDTLLRHADHLNEGRQLILGLVAAGQTNLVDVQVMSCLGHGLLGGAEISTCQRLLAKHGNCPPPYSTFVPVEWARQLDAIQFVCTKAKLDPDRYSFFVNQIAKASVEGGEQVFDPVQARNAVNKYFEDMMAIAKRPYSLQNCLAFESLDDEAQMRFAKFQLLRITIPKLTRSYQLMLRVYTERKGTILLLGVHDFRSQHGNWPKSLSELKIKNLSALRTDPYSEKDFRYSIRENGFTLYSIGADGKDDKGRHDPKWGESEGGGDYVFWPVQDTPSATSKPRGE
ncbi:MAG: hypothetical protein HZA51_01875 [Planctomycetes bacterium]|nr:hypothetical protein [Planctomycetota bacterium]